MPPYFRYFSLSSRSSAICLLISRRWGLSAISMCQECCYLQRCFPAHQVYEAVEFSNDDPIVTKALKKKRVSAVKVTWGPEPTDFMCLACTIFELVVAVVELPRPQTFGHWLRMMLVVILKLKAGSIIHARSICGSRMADRQPVCTNYLSPCRSLAVPICACPEKPYLRIALALFLAQALGFTWTVEMPAKLTEHPRWQVFARRTKMFGVRFWVTCWGGRVSPKKLRILSNSRAIMVFRRVQKARLERKLRKLRIFACNTGKGHTGSHGGNIV